MWNFLAPPAHKQELPAEKIDSAYKSYRWQVFKGGKTKRVNMWSV